MGLSQSALVMLVMGATIIYGGLAYFLYRALKSMKK
jgi:hypothetical protein